MSLESANQGYRNAETQLKFFKVWFSELAETLPEDKADELKDLLNEALSWQKSVAYWEQQVTYWSAKEAVYPPPGV